MASPWIIDFRVPDAHDVAMAKETIIRLTDDLDGTEASETIKFGFEGRNYEIDLSDKNIAAFRKAMEKYVERARHATSSAPTNTGGRGRAGRSRTSSYDPEEGRAARQWAAEHGIEGLPVRGRTPAAIIEQWRAAAK
jgi:hypothetical protein